MFLRRWEWDRMQTKYSLDWFIYTTRYKHVEKVFPNQVSISSKYITLVFFVQNFCQSQNVTRKSCQKRLSYKKFACITLMKLTAGGRNTEEVNYTSPVLFKLPGLRRFTINALLAIFSLHYETKTVWALQLVDKKLMCAAFKINSILATDCCN